MSSSSGSMFLAVVAMEAAAFAASLEAGGRFAEFALGEAERTAASACAALRVPSGWRQRAWEDTAQGLLQSELETVRLLAGLPRVWLLLYLAELDRIRGPRPLP